MKLSFSPIAILAFVLLSHTANAAPPEDSTQAAREFVKQGSAEYTKQHWEAARAAFLKAWELKHHYAIAANLADVELKLGRYRDAAKHLKYAIANLPPEHTDKRAEAEASLKECRAHLSAVRVSVNVADATVKLDDQEFAPETLADELLLDPGAHKLEAQRGGYLSSSREFTAVAGEAREIRLELSPQPPLASLGSGATSHLSAAAPNANASDSGTNAHISPRTWVLIGGGAATVVAAGLGTFFTLRASSLGSDADSLRAQTQAEGSPALVAKDSECQPGAPMRPAACDQLTQTLKSRATATNLATASWITAGALGVATVATYFLWPVKEGGSAAQSARVSVAPWLVGARGGALRVDF